MDATSVDTSRRSSRREENARASVTSGIVTRVQVQRIAFNINEISRSPFDRARSDPRSKFATRRVPKNPSTKSGEVTNPKVKY